MKKIYSLVPIILCITVLSSCGKTETESETDKNKPSNSYILSSKDSSEDTENKVLSENEETKEKNINEKETEEPKQIIKATINAKAGYADDNHQVIQF